VATVLVACAACSILWMACSTARRQRGVDRAGWSVARAIRAVPANPDLCENTWQLARPPGGPWDVITLHRMGLCGEDRTDVRSGFDVLYLPGTHMNGQLMVLDEAYDFRLYLARRHIAVWSLDYRTHAVPPTAGDLEPLRDWTTDIFLDDAAAALAFMRLTGRRPIVAGFSRGAMLAYVLAERDPPDQEQSIAGLVIFDGFAPGALPGLGKRPKPPGAAIDVGSARLPYDERQALLARVIANPSTPSVDPAFETSGDRLAYILFSSRTFGGRGGLSAALHGRADIRTVAGVLAGYDRYWPAAATRFTSSDAPPRSTVPVFAVASTNIGPSFTAAVEDSARQRGGEDAEVIVLPGHGHLDVLVGTDVRTLVFEPLLRWIGRLGMLRPS
jgi:pimeloyl-ACP methyl ester carboxylesterase